MTRDFTLRAEWLKGDFESPLDQATFAEISVSVDGQLKSGIYDPATGSTYSGARLPAIVLAEGLARRWWTLLYEPQRTLERQPRDKAFEARHRLDSLTAGYVFPPIGMWSSGDTISAQFFTPDLRFQRQRFESSETKDPWTLSRGDVQDELSDFIRAVLDQAHCSNHQADELRASWDRIQTSIQDREEFEWCRNAGRLALDPYDPDILDLSRLSAGISEPLFEDICDAAEIGELQRTCDWVRGASSRLKNAQPISLHSFGAPPRRDLTLPGFKHGYAAAEMLRIRLNLPKDPVKAVDQVLQGADKIDRGSFTDNSPDIIEGVVRRQKTEFHADVPARSVRQRRFRMCRATYLAWRASYDTEVAATPAETFRQQASRSFAAELIAPASLIKERFGRTGLTSLSVERLASEWQCPPRTIVHQAQNNGVTVRGVETAAYY